jgi:hypothetical protein
MVTEKQSLTFISYSRNNKDFALELAKELKESGFQIWFDLLDIPTGARWDDEIEKALERCDIFMVILTPSSITSENVKDEIGYAIDSKKRILPILLKNANVPLRLRRFQYVDFTNVSYDEGIDLAKQLLRKLIDEQTSSLPESSVPANTEGQQPNVDRSAELKAEASRLARQKAEAIRKAREQEQKDRQVQASQRNQSFERSVSRSNQKQSPARLYSIILGIPLVALLCLGGGWSAWRLFSSSPTNPNPPAIATTVTPITATPSITPSVTATTEVPTITPIPTTPAPPIPDTVKAVTDYWNYRSIKDYESAWNILSTSFQEHHQTYFEDRNGENYCRIETDNGKEISNDGSTADVFITVKFYSGACPGTEAIYDYKVTVTFDPVSQRWRFDKSVEVKK